MKRTLSLALAAALLLALAGCTTPTPSTPSTDPTTTAAATTTATTAAAPTEEATTTAPADPTTGEATDPTTGEVTAPTTGEHTHVTTTGSTAAPTTSTTVKTTSTTKKKPAFRFDYDVYEDLKRASGMYFTNTANSFRDSTFSYSGSTPKWLYTQEGSKYNLGREGVYTNPAKGVHQYQDTSKLLYIDTNTGLFKMDILGSKEYDRPRKAGEKFCGALMTPQSLTGRIMVKDISALYATLDFELTEVTCCLTDDELDLGLHTAQWNYYVFVQDAQSSDWFYVGLPLYDWRNFDGQQDPYISTDPGTNNTFVYIPDSPSVFGAGNHVKVGERFACDVDMLPLIKDAFATAQKRGFFPGKSLDTFYINGCNLGWEIPGTFDCKAVVYEYNLTYTE